MDGKKRESIACLEDSKNRCRSFCRGACGEVISASVSIEAVIKHNVVNEKASYEAIIRTT